MGYTANIDAADGWYLGEDKSLRITVYTSTATADTIEAGTATAENITGWALSWMLKRKLSDADVDAALTKTTVSGIALTTPASGLCTVTVADTDTDALSPGTYVHELKRTDAGNEAVLVQGTVELLRAVHRA